MDVESFPLIKLQKYCKIGYIIQSNLQPHLFQTKKCKNIDNLKKYKIQTSLPMIFFYVGIFKKLRSLYPKKKCYTQYKQKVKKKLLYYISFF
jgi:hypothetical protein